MNTMRKTTELGYIPSNTSGCQARPYKCGDMVSVIGKMKDYGAIQKGFISIEIAIAVFVASILFVVFVDMQRSQNLERMAYNTGILAGQANNGIRAYITDLGAATPAATHSDLNFLKSTNCPTPGTAARHYLNCDFPADLDLGLAYDITITNDGTTVNATMALGIPNDGGEDIPYLAGSVVLGANSAAGISDEVITAYFFATHSLDGNITITTDNTPGTDVYLRRDGSNQPTGDFDWNNFDIDNINNVTTHTLTFDDGVDTVILDVAEGQMLADIYDLDCGAEGSLNVQSDGVIGCTTGVPTDLIAPFPGACPTGWSDFGVADGRMLIGSGSDGLGNSYTVGDTGGEAFHTLTIEELPSHTVDTTVPLEVVPGLGLFFSDSVLSPGGNDGSSTVTSEPVGGDEPHENRPPYYVINWCQRD